MNSVKYRFGSTLKVLAFPRDSNPYQSLLYEELERLGVAVTYAGELTPSRTVNVLLLPFELALRRLRGARLLHIHWVFGFAFPAVPRAGRVVAQLQFALVLLVCRALGIRIIWTAHNVLPHSPVFANDLLARRWLVQASAVVVTHDERALAELNQLGLRPRRAAVIPPGPFAPPVRAQALRPAGSEAGPWRLLFFGKISPYKGVEELLIAATELDPDVELEIVVAGECDDPALAERLRTLARAGRGRVELRLHRVPDDDVSPLIESADAVVLPYLAVTTSSTLLVAQQHARPVLVSNLPAFAELDGAAPVRYDGTVAGLRDALCRFASLQPWELAAAGAAAAAQASGASWLDAARATYAAFMAALDCDAAAA